MTYKATHFGAAAFAGLLFSAAAPLASAADNSATPPKVDIITICYNVAMVCQDACGKATMTETESAKCDKGCTDSLSACLGQSASQSSAGNSKNPTRPKRKTKKYTAPN